MSVKPKLLFLQLNELNFEVVQKYIDAGHPLPNFQSLISMGLVTTESENSYELLEPWIQWPSVHTGMSFSEHRVFRLGDIVDSTAAQIFEEVERMGMTVGVISAMNADNRLQQPKYFIPDPWTVTPPDKSWFSRYITDVLRQAVNDNSSERVSIKTTIKLALVFLQSVRIKSWLHYFSLAIKARGKPWRKALVLDELLFDIHSYLSTKRDPDFTTLFLNAGAHIQHRYFYNSPYNGTGNSNPSWLVTPKYDPVKEMLDVYERLLGRLLAQCNYQLLVATGLSQQPFAAPQYYYRLRDHAAFLKVMGVDHLSVSPRMTRDFLINFQSNAAAQAGEMILKSLRDENGVEIFGVVDNRGDSLFVTLTYAEEVTESTRLVLDGLSINFFEHVVFVALKNGEHCSRGYVVSSFDIRQDEVARERPVWSLNSVIKEFFKTQ